LQKDEDKDSIGLYIKDNGQRNSDASMAAFSGMDDLVNSWKSRQSKDLMASYNSNYQGINNPENLKLSGGRGGGQLQMSGGRGGGASAD
jgi:hypothetical protein